MIPSFADKMCLKNSPSLVKAETLTKTKRVFNHTVQNLQALVHANEGSLLERKPVTYRIVIKSLSLPHFKEKII